VSSESNSNSQGQVVSEALPETKLRDLLSNQTFMRYWLSRVAAGIASQMFEVALAWQMYQLTSSAWDLGLVGLYQFLPALALTLVAGHVADRFPREKIILLTWVLQGFVVLLVLLALQGDFLSRSLLLWVSLSLGVFRAFQSTAQQALLPSLVDPVILPRATALNSMGYQASVMAGPAMGGLLFAINASWVYSACFVLYLLSGFWLWGLKSKPLPHANEPVTLESVLAGVVFVWKQKTILGSMSLDLFAVLLGGATALLPIYAKDILHTGAWGLGLLRASPAVGALIMSLCLAHWPLNHKVGQKLLLAVGVFGLSIIVFGLSHVFWVSMLALMVSGGADMVSVVIRLTLVQMDTPESMRGRVSAVNSVFIGASNELGEFESGATAAWFGSVESVIIGGVGTLLVAVLWRFLFKELYHRDRLRSEAA
jgi:MFS family permease